MKKFQKLFANKIKSIDEDARQAEFIISTDQPDRHGEIVAQDWKLENYEKNPIVLFGHDAYSAETVVGKCEHIETGEADDGSHFTKALVQFAEEGTSQTADTVWKLVKQDILRTVSVGFIPHAFKNEDKIDEPTILAENELLEFSIVPIPANPNAVALAYEDGSLNEKDARFLEKSYKAQLGLLHERGGDIMKSTTEAKRKKSMTDEEIAKISEAVAGAVAEAIAPKFDELLEKLDADKKPEEEEPAEEPEEGEEVAEAKSEQVDEDGAFDENEELDEEAEKAFRAELEKDYNAIINK